MYSINAASRFTTCRLCASARVTAQLLVYSKIARLFLKMLMDNFDRENGTQCSISYFGIFRKSVNCKPSRMFHHDTRFEFQVCSVKESGQMITAVLNIYYGTSQCRFCSRFFRVAQCIQ